MAAASHSAQSQNLPLRIETPVLVIEQPILASPTIPLFETATTVENRYTPNHESKYREPAAGVRHYDDLTRESFLPRKLRVITVGR
jgi:hypothetical protein